MYLQPHHPHSLKVHWLPAALGLVCIMLISCVGLHAQLIWKQQPGLTGGAPYFIVPDNNAGVIYAGMYVGGMYRSLDSGRTWEQINNGLTRLGVRSIHVNGHGGIFIGISGSGVWRSSDSGMHWVDANDGVSPSDRGVDVGVFSQDDSSCTIALMGRQVYRFNDGSATWLPIGGRLTGRNATAMDVDSSGTIYIAMNGSGVVRSLPGDVWGAIDSGLVDLTVTSLVVGHNGKIYVGTYSGVFRSDNQGATWSAVNTGLGDNVPFISHIYSLSDGDLVISNANGIYRSDDDGDHWLRVTATAPNQGFAVAFDSVMLGSVGAPLNRCRFDDTTWQVSAEGLRTWTVNSLVATRMGVLLAGSLNGWFISSDGGERWDTLAAIDGAHITGRMVPLRDGESIVLGRDSVKFRSSDGGLTWGHTASTDGGSFARFAEMADSSIIKVVGPDLVTYRFYRSTDHGAQWTFIGVDSVHDSPTSCFAIGTGTILVAKGQGGVVRYDYSGGVLRHDTTVLPRAHVSTWVLAGDGTVFTGASAFQSGDPTGLFRSTDTGRTWEQVNAGLRDTAVTALFCDGRMVYIGTGAGLYRGDVAASSWSACDDGMEGTAIASLAKGADGHLYAGTSERSLFRTVNAVSAVPGAHIRAESGSWMTTAPNPARSLLRVVMRPSQNCHGHIAAFTLDGRYVADVYSGDLPVTGLAVSWDIGQLPTGIYLLRLESGTHRESMPVVISR